MTAFKNTVEYNLSDKNYNEYENELDDLADRINSLNDRLTTSNIENMISESRQKLDKWRSDCYSIIDRFYEQKCREFDRHVAEIIDRQRKEINRIRSSMATFIHKQDILSKDIDYLTTITNQLEHDMHETKEKYLQIDTRLVEVRENSIEIQKTNDISNTSVISPPYKTINYVEESSKILCANERHLLVHDNSNLCLFDKDLNIIRDKFWSHGCILDICWSLTLARFLILTRNYLYLVDESTLSIIRVQKIPKLSWWSCTCSDTSLYVTTKDWASNIYQFTLWPSIQLVKRWQSPYTCKQNETISNIIYNKEKIALMIYNRLTKTKSIELRVSTTLDCLWSLNLDIAYDCRAIRCCSFNNDEWLVTDWNTSNLHYISNDGKLKLTSEYNTSPFCGTMLGTNIFVISTIDGINLHKV